MTYEEYKELIRTEVFDNKIKGIKHKFFFKIL